jgi:hypothetical protein
MRLVVAAAIAASPVSRARANQIRSGGFTSYVSDTRYGWVAFCERASDDITTRIVFDWDSPRHSTDDDVSTGQRAHAQGNAGRQCRRQRSSVCADCA